jgi:hypothetical protein
MVPPAYEEDVVREMLYTAEIEIQDTSSYIFAHNSFLFSFSLFAYENNKLIINHLHIQLFNKIKK